MPNLKNLSSLFQLSINKAKSTNPTSLKKRLTKSPNSKFSPKKLSQPSPVEEVDSIRSLLAYDDSTHNSEGCRELFKDIEASLRDGKSLISTDSQETNGGECTENSFNIPWISNLAGKNASQQQKVKTRMRRGQWIFKASMANHFDQLVKTCGKQLGEKGIVDLFSKLRGGTGVKEYNALIKLCIGKARRSHDEDAALDQISLILQLITSMKEQGFPLEEETYGPPLMYFIELGMEEEFHFVCNLSKNGNPSSISRLGYYEMLLYVGLDDQEKIQEICSYISTNGGDDTADLRENYLLALCDSDRKEELLQLLDTIDITKISSVDHVASIFKSFGRLLLESSAEKFLLALKDFDYGAENISNLIFNYATSLQNLAVEDVFSKFMNLHSILEMAPSSETFEKLVLYSCNLLKVHEALDIVQKMCEEGLTLSIDTLNCLLRAIEESFEFNLVRRIYSLICNHGLEPTTETFTSLITLCVKMKDFDGAYAMLNDLKKFNLKPAASMYNAIMAGYFREKNIDSALMVLKQMKLAGVNPDAQTYSYLINNCNSEEKIIKYYEKFKLAKIQAPKNVYMALINAYATCGQFEKAKEVLLDPEIPTTNSNEIKSVLVSALASRGQISDALTIYKEIEEEGCSLEPKAVIALIEYFQSEGDFNILTKLLEELHGTSYWVDGCCRVILYGVRNKHLSSAVDLLKQLKDRFHKDELALEVLLDEIFLIVAETEPIELQIGMDLLEFLKNELGISPSRKCLDFLLSACIKAKDLQHSLLIWKEYQAAGLPYNAISYLRMYQALLASGDHESARTMLTKIPKEDPHVCILVQECQRIYTMAASNKGSKSKKEKKTIGN